MPAFATGMAAALLNQLFASLHTRAKLRFLVRRTYSMAYERPTLVWRRLFSGPDWAAV